VKLDESCTSNPKSMLMPNLGGRGLGFHFNRPVDVGFRMGCRNESRLELRRRQVNA
jgi:hypothetical protein